MGLSVVLEENIAVLKQKLPIGRSFDIVTREMTLCGVDAYWVGINGMCKTDTLQKLFGYLQNPAYLAIQSEFSSKEGELLENIQRFAASKIGYVQTELCDDWDTICKNIVSGPTALFLNGCAQAVILDVRTYPTRGIEEPDVEKVTRGSRDGFVETMLFNTNLIRRRIRSNHLTFEIMSVGTDSKTDVAIAYVGGLVEKQLLDKVKETIGNLKVSSLTMGTKSLEELLLRKHWYHPLPVVQVTERPDVACSYLMEGHMIIIVDNTPSVIILPTTIFQFTQNVEDYYKSPLVGNYLRWMRFACVWISLLLLPVFMLVAGFYPELADQIKLMETEPLTRERLFFYVLAVDFGLDLFRYSSAHSTSRFSGAMSIVGGLIIGDIAVQLNWASVEVIFYAALTLLATMSLPSIEFGEGLRIYRLFLILTTGFLGPVGFWGGLALVLLSTVTTPTFSHKSYLWPLAPFNWKALKTLLWRCPTFKAQPSNVWDRTEKKRA
ncbi:MAG: spore germination protein [Lachnospiraceae bacterium]|nr:spore germination protein [Lachnospiraceae bacterium]MDE6743449.1 spore germination protein [Lachnospiraceae bacterium]